MHCPPLLARSCARITLLLAFLLAGCGFQPIYGTNGPAAGTGAGTAFEDLTEAFAGIDVAPMRDRVGQKLRNDLVSTLTPRGEAGTPRYSLQMELKERFEGYAFREDRAITRQRLQLDARMVLVDLESGEIALSDDLSAWMAYDVVQSDFANLSAERDARDRAAAQLVDKVVARLARYFRRDAP
ncbi:twin-arginine translocation pathway signal protein [Iodidimonas gelatinilytica]|uniref:Twin-arginine translocation pathway signal protein n=1 Tax=Iodidimonas gelatinilytica TaxID=1236966 RepID=A0A5A7MZR9_9PROT|nr:LPS assembly lipoprotein LptE [Iodidimonas gelatinilytica]GER01561.1 twin-arginine translocation pathway signal protein [Iodidimonas gelatinilytica]